MDVELLVHTGYVGLCRSILHAKLVGDVAASMSIAEIVEGLPLSCRKTELLRHQTACHLDGFLARLSKLTPNLSLFARTDQHGRRPEATEKRKTATANKTDEKGDRPFIKGSMSQEGE